MSLIGQNITRAKQANKQQVLLALLRYGPISRQQIAEHLHLTPATITNLTAELLDEGVICDKGSIEGQERRAGRKFVALDLNERAIYVVGVHIRMDLVEIGLVNLKGAVLAKSQYTLAEKPDQNEFVRQLIAHLEAFLSEHPGKQVMSIGIGSTGLVHFESGTVLRADNMGWTEFALAERISRHFGLPAFLDHNVRAMAHAEKMYGNSKQLSDFMCLYIGQGIGAGLVIRDAIYRSGLSGGGEFGHVTYVSDGEPCWCGNRGCLERYASNAAIIQQLSVSSIAEVLQRCEAGDEQARQAIETAGERIGLSLASFINMFHFSKVVVGGAMAQEKYPFLGRIRATLRERSFLARKEEVTIEASGFGDLLGISGAASLALLYGVFSK